MRCLSSLKDVLNLISLEKFVAVQRIHLLGSIKFLIILHIITSEIIPES